MATDMNSMPYGKEIDLIYEDLTYIIRGILFEVHVRAWKIC